MKKSKDYLLGFKAGQEEERDKWINTVQYEMKIKQQTLKQIEEWAEENKTSYWDEENIRLEDLKKFINTL
jgi:hypothetical protein